MKIGVSRTRRGSRRRAKPNPNSKAGQSSGSCPWSTRPRRPPHRQDLDVAWRPSPLSSHRAELLSGRGPASQQGAGGRAEPGSEQRRRTAHELEERELITRRRDPADRRRHIVELSPSGEDELALAYAQLRQVEDDLLSALSAEERATLYDLLIRAVGAKSPPCDAADESPASPA